MNSALEKSMGFISKFFKNTWLIILALILLFQKGNNAQDYSLGGGFNFTYQSVSLSLGLGANLNGEYRFIDECSGRLSLGYKISTFRRLYFGTDTYTQGSIEGDFIFHPINFFVQPYVGIGLGYYMPSTKISGMPHYLVVPRGSEDRLVTSNQIDNDFGYSLLGGFKFGANSFFSVSLEFNYTILKPNWTAQVYGAGSSFHETHTEELDLSLFTTGLTFNFRL